MIYFQQSQLLILWNNKHKWINILFNSYYRLFLWN